MKVPKTRRRAQRASQSVVCRWPAVVSPPLPMAAAATTNAKRPHDAIGTVEHDYSRALQVLQITLPLLRPTQAGAPLDASACLELLVEQWSKDAAEHDATVTPYKARIASRDRVRRVTR